MSGAASRWRLTWAVDGVPAALEVSAHGRALAVRRAVEVMHARFPGVRADEGTLKLVAVRGAR